MEAASRSEQRDGAVPRPVVRELLSLTGPAISTSLLQTLVFLADRVMLGRYDQDALASMQVQGPVVWSLTMIFGGLTVGTVALVARSVGAGDRGRAEAAARASLRIAATLGVVVMGLCFVTAEAIAAVVGPQSPALRALSADYLRIAAFAFPAVFVAHAAAFVFHGAGNTRIPFLFGALANVVNVAASLTLIFGAQLGPITVPELGVTGAAAGSVLALSVEAALLVAALARWNGPVRVAGMLRRARLAGDRRALADLIRISVPAFLERSVNNGGYIAYAAVIASLGPLVMASNQTLITLESICFLSADGFAIAAGSVVGRSLGAGRTDAARHAGWTAAGLAAVALTTLGVVIWATSGLTLRAFVPAGADGTELIRASESALPLLVAAQPFMAFAIVLGQSLRGAGDTRTPFVAALIGGLFIRVALAWWLGTTTTLGVRAVWIASGADWVVRTVLLAAVFARGRWTSVRL